MFRNEEILRQLARFENLFHRDNLRLGARIWIRTNLVIFLAAVPLSLLPIPAELFLAIGFALTIVLFQRASGKEAARLYGIIISPWCWWSINWRVAAYLLPLTFILAFMLVSSYPDFSETAVRENPGPLAGSHFVLFVFSVVPMGLATSQAFLVSLRRQKALSALEGGPGMRTDGDGPKDS